MSPDVLWWKYMVTPGPHNFEMAKAPLEHLNR